MFLRSKVRFGLFSAVCVYALSLCAPAQQMNVDPVQAASQSSAETNSLSSTAILAILKTRPELMIDLKKVAADSLRARGNDVSEDAITDEMLYAQITSDAELRGEITSWLWTRGYVSQAELDQRRLATQQELKEADNPQLGVTRNSFSQLPQVNPTLSSSIGQSSVQNATRAATSKETTSDIETSTNAASDSAQRNLEPQGDPNRPAQDGLVHQPTPLNLLALRDLYTQVPEPTSSLRRFGSDAFVRRGVKAAEMPTDVPVGPDYVLGPGDTVTISLWGSMSQSLVRVVDHEGRIVLPEAGPVMVAGLSLEQARLLAENTLKPQFRNIKVQLSVSRVRTVRIYVVGDVQRPGAYDVSSLSTALSALYAAGGPTAVGSLRTIRHMRNGTLVREIDLYDFLLRGLQADSERLLPGDTVLVPPTGRQVTVAGMVRRPAIYELRNEQSLDDVLSLSGGLLVSAATTQIKVNRIRANEGRVTETVRVDDPNEAAGLRKALRGYAVSDGDEVVVAPILPYSERAVYVEGHVVRPGKFAYRDNMQITDLLHSYADLLPEPADRGEVIRLLPPDFRPETISFSVSEAMIGNTQLRLRPFDTVRILGRYQLDAPKVTIQGEVLRPGSYSLPEKLTAAQFVRLAGGFKRSALHDHADLTSYEVKEGRAVASHRISVDIGRAVDDADQAADIVLKAGDVLTIHQIAGWTDIGASVTISGEVAYPGTYGIQDGERLSSVLKRAGGFRNTAYPAGALLTRRQVKDFQEKSRQELIRQIEATSAATKFAPTAIGGDQAATLQLVVQQQEQVLQRLRAQTSSGRLVIRIDNEAGGWENSSADIELRAGDVLEIPKRPGFVLVTGQVYNSAAITFTPGKSAGWYLRRSGGPTEMASKKEIFVIRANGSVVGRDSGEWFGSDVLRTKLNPGDVVVVPQKIIGGSAFWRNLLATAQFMSSFAITAKVAGF